jgi:hypothetical protein
MLNKRAGLWAKGTRPGLRKNCVSRIGTKSSGRFGAILVPMETFLPTQVIMKKRRHQIRMKLDTREVGII